MLCGFDHNAARGLGVPSQSAALLTLLVLRGPQTSAELRLHTERLHRFADISSVEGFLNELAEREPIRVVRLPKAPGEREARWAHLLCGEVQLPPASHLTAATASDGSGAQSETRAEIESLKAEVADLKSLVHRLAAGWACQPTPPGMSWHGQLDLHYQRQGNRTTALDRHEGPLRVLQRLYPKATPFVTHVLVHPGAGWWRHAGTQCPPGCGHPRPHHHPGRHPVLPKCRRPSKPICSRHPCRPGQARVAALESIAYPGARP